MRFDKDHIYHIYNRSNQQVFLNDDNYLFFLRKIKKHIYPCCNIIAYCLMPNHFHFMIEANDETIKYCKDSSPIEKQLLTQAFATVLSSYTQAYNKQNNRRGALWAHKTKAKSLTELAHYQSNSSSNRGGLGVLCFQYIHQNPIRADLVSRIEDWIYSSYLDYAGLRKGNLIDKDTAYQILEIDKEFFMDQSNVIYDERAESLY